MSLTDNIRKDLIQIANKKDTVVFITGHLWWKKRHKASEVIANDRLFRKYCFSAMCEY